jgi:hypothetical protein
MSTLWEVHAQVCRAIGWSPRRRWLTGAMLPLAVTGVLAAAAVLPTTAAASGGGCTSFPGSPVPSCVTVDGSGLYVQQVQAGVEVPASVTAVGRFHVWGEGLNWYSGQQFFKARWWSYQTFRSTWITVNRRVAPGEICASWEGLTSPGHYGGDRPACLTVHS